MFHINKKLTCEENYKEMLNTVKLTIADENDEIANLANISAVINCYMEKINWVGFYIFKEGQLVLGPFQGNPACIRIQIGKGVCGTAALKKETIVVPNVHDFPGHITCDTETNSEIVLPILKNGNLYGVLDIDSPELNRFGNLEKKYLEQIVEIVASFLV